MKVGDVVYRPRWNSHAKAFVYDELTIIAIGRKWVQTDLPYVRFEKSTLMIDRCGYGNEASVFFSREDHEREVAISKAWREFVVSVRDRYSLPPNMTLEKIAEARRVLGLGEGE